MKATYDQKRDCIKIEETHYATLLERKEALKLRDEITKALENQEFKKMEMTTQ